MINKNYNIENPNYSEPAALQQLLQATYAALDEQDKLFDDTPCATYVFTDQFVITVGGVQTAFMLGGPQADAIAQFIAHIAYENGYEVDYKNGTVKE